MNKISVFALCLLFFNCSLKPKEILHLERGLDILNNKKEINQTLNDSIKIKTIAVIRDEIKDTKTLVLMLDKNVSKSYLNNYWLEIGIKSKPEKTSETKTFFIKPDIIKTKTYTYLTHEITYKENKINTFKIALYSKNEKKRLSSMLEIKNLYTNND